MEDLCKCFFVISGFLITSLLLREELKEKISLKNFYLRRTIRIFLLIIFFYLCILYFALFKDIEIGQVSWLSFDLH
jgi:peptidoglycan/LPS O-acetylase OafA/YrhL